MNRVLHLIDTTGPGGAETIFTALASRFSQSATWSSIAVVRGPGWVYDQLMNHGVETVVLESKGSLNLAFLLSLQKLILQQKVDLVHAHLLGSNVYASIAGALTKRPVISTFHGFVDISAHERFSYWKFGAIKYCSTIVAVSSELKASVADRLNIPQQRVHLIPNAIDCQRFAQAPAMPLRQQLNINHSTRLLGALGNIRPAKDYENALRALALLREQGQDVELIIAGHQKEPLFSELMSLRSELGLNESVHFLGFVQQPERFLASLDIFLLSSSSEGHPLALTQAMAAGVPIVATRCGVERVISEQTAWLAPTADSAALASAINNALTNRPETARRAQKARTEAFEKYDFEGMLNNYRVLYQSLLKTT